MAAGQPDRPDRSAAHDARMRTVKRQGCPTCPRQCADLGRQPPAGRPPGRPPRSRGYLPGQTARPPAFRGFPRVRARGPLAVWRSGCLPRSRRWAGRHYGWLRRPASPGSDSHYSLLPFGRSGYLPAAARSATARPAQSPGRAERPARPGRAAQHLAKAELGRQRFPVLVPGHRKGRLNGRRVPFSAAAGL